MAEAADVASAPPPGSLEAERAAVAVTLKAYVESRFGKTAATAVYPREAVSELFVAVSGEMINLRNFWSGNWRSEWTIVLGETGAMAKGEVRVRALASAP